MNCEKTIHLNDVSDLITVDLKPQDGKLAIEGSYLRNNLEEGYFESEVPLEASKRYTVRNFAYDVTPNEALRLKIDLDEHALQTAFPQIKGDEIITAIDDLPMPLASEAPHAGVAENMKEKSKSCDKAPMFAHLKTTYTSLSKRP